MVAFGNRCEPFSIVTPTRANSEGKLQNFGQQFQKTFSISWPISFLTLKHAVEASEAVLEEKQWHFQLVIAVQALDQWEASIY